MSVGQFPAGATAGRSKALRALFFGGILPVIAFTVIEERFGTLWGLLAGMIFGAGEISWEWFTQRRVQAMTWAGNGLILVLGAVSLLTDEGIWFKLQPALIESVMALVLIGSAVLGRPLMILFMTHAMKQQGIVLDFAGPEGSRGDLIRKALGGMTWRLGVFFLLQAALAAWAAFRWSTTHWALLKGVGFTVSTIVYIVAESLVLRRRLIRSAGGPASQSG